MVEIIAKRGRTSQMYLDIIEQSQPSMSKQDFCMV